MGVAIILRQHRYNKLKKKDILSGFFCLVGDGVIASTSAAVLTLHGPATSTSPGTAGVAECIDEAWGSFTCEFLLTEEASHSSIDTTTSSTADDQPYAASDKRETSSRPLSCPGTHPQVALQDAIQAVQ